MVAATHGLLSSMLWKCVAHKEKQVPKDREHLDKDLLRFVDRISNLYENISCCVIDLYGIISNSIDLYSFISIYINLY